MLSDTHLQCADGSPFQEGNEPTHKKTRDLHPTTSNCCQIKIGVSDFSFCLHANISLTTN